MEDKELLKKRMKLYKALGAEQFQKVVFAFEKLKFKVIDKLFPNLQKNLENKAFKRMNKILEGDYTEEEKEEIARAYKKAVLISRVEFRTKKNINYHINESDPTEIIDYLQLNKLIHLNGLKTNGLVGLISILGIVLGTMFPVIHAVSTISIILLILDTIDTIINIECVNIQNYNLCRVERIKNRLEARQRKKLERLGEQSAAIDLIAGKVNESPTLPSMKEILNGATPEQLRQLKQMILAETQERLSKNEGSNKK